MRRTNSRQDRPTRKDNPPADRNREWPGIGTHPAPSPAHSPVYLKGLGWAASAALIIFAYLNIGPYEQAIRLLFGSGEISGLAAFILSLPLVSTMVLGARNLISWVLGAILWALLQGLELLPMLLFNSRRALKGVIAAGERGDVLPVNRNDDPALASLKKAYNRLPYSLVRNFRNAALFAYLIDICICLRVYPPVDGGIDQALLILTTGAFQLVDWGNVGMLLVTLFAVEALVWLALRISELRSALLISRYQA